MKARFFAILGAYLLAGASAAEAGFITYTVGVTNPAGPTTYTFTFGTPMAPILGLADYSFSSLISLTDGGNNGVSAGVGAVYPEFWQLSVGDASNVYTVLDDVGGTGSVVGAGPHNFSASGVFDCSVLSGGCSSLSLTFSALLSGDGDQLSSTGTFDLSPSVTRAPEPVTLSLFGAGLAAAVTLRRRRKNTP